MLQLNSFPLLDKVDFLLEDLAGALVQEGVVGVVVGQVLHQERLVDRAARAHREELHMGRHGTCNSRGERENISKVMAI